MHVRDPIASAVLGTLVGTALLPFVLVSPVLGGAVTGYLGGETPREASLLGGFAGSLQVITALAVLGTIGNGQLAALTGSRTLQLSRPVLAGMRTEPLTTYVLLAAGVVAIVAGAAIGGGLGYVGRRGPTVS